jgi:hypothetical protein
MRTLIAVVLGAPLMFVMAADLAQAQNYPWCAAGSYKDGARSCGYVSFEQCMAAIQGGSAFCEQNPMYRPGGEIPPLRRQPRR